MIENEKRINDILTSMEGSQKASPPPSLLSKIEGNLETEARIIPLRYLRLAAAAVILLLMVNGLLLEQYLQNDYLASDDPSAEQANDEQLISNYQLYEEWTN